MRDADLLEAAADDVGAALNNLWAAVDTLQAAQSALVDTEFAGLLDAALSDLLAAGLVLQGIDWE
jgi:hypothetical protein